MNAWKTHRTAAVIGLGVVCASGAGNPPAGGGSAAAKDAGTKVNLCDHALRLMEEGNERFVAGKSVHPNTDVFRVADTGGHGQHPFAAVLTCADSRVAVERLFDRGVGDLFVVRVAGNICDPNECGSVEYACEHLGTQLVVVMGHSKCGAVKAAVELGGGECGKNLGSLLDNIGPAVKAVREAHPELAGDQLVGAVVRENVWQGIEDMFKSSTSMREMVERGSVKVVGAVYDVASGKVEWLGQHAAQAGLVKGEAATASSAATTDRPAPVAEKMEKPIAGKSAAEKTGFVKAAAPAKKTAEEKDEHKPVAAHPEHH